jgi:two-component system, response regulator YesN
MGDASVGYDFAELCADYTRATGMRCEYLEIGRDDADDPLTGVSPESGVCPACNDLLRHDASGASIHRLAAYHAERYGGRYVYFCPWTMLHWASPVITDGMLAGAFVCGPALLFEPDSLYFEEIRARLGLDDAAMTRIVPVIESLPVLSPERATSLSRLLFHLALSASDHAAGAFFADRDAFEQQSHIGEYLQHIKTMEGDKRSDLEYPIEKERELLALTAAGDHAGAVRVLDELMAIIFYTSGANLEMVKSRVLELTVLLSRAAVQGGADVEQIFGLNFHYLTRIRQIDSVEELTRWTRRIIARFTDLVFTLRPVNHSHGILRAMRYIREHYAERLQVAEVAALAGLSSTYFSKLFRVETQTTFTEYLSRIRIDEAKRRLLAEDTRLGDLADACGFEDQSYFTKVFVRLVGVTPSRYRQTRGRVVRPEPRR